ncbi:Phosphoserine phosphatase RsbP [Nocardioides dokdonensis FR1436]|uniref:Phosphoserine phosphatase RsbP n=1 Tax=Nocardioides dokdonensis FR1436 TaxID=1300347 RepID=A0A1A9GGU2_9ACTN|nr:SpoIIE family protein phosphatase [Nocardioides dokdonensis]ANH37454.1 Phosphoserine phosphatase RsbP [Nocardioides dokdonensis FR1436]
MPHPDLRAGPGTELRVAFDRYARMVRRTLGTDIALVSLVEEQRQVFIGADGLDGETEESRQTPLSHSFCQWVVADREPLVITDARLDDRLQHNLAIPDLGVVGYAGHPIHDQNGAIVGSLCAISRTPREWSRDDLEALQDLAASCSSELAQRGLRHEAAQAAEHAASLSRRSRVLLALSEGLASTRTLSEVAVAVERVSIEQLGCSRAGIWIDALSAAAGQPEPIADDATLHYVPRDQDDWRSAHLNQRLSQDDSNPLGSAMVRQAPVWFHDRAGQNAEYAHLDLSAQVGEARAFLPLFDTGGVALGAMALIWDDPRDQTREDLRTMTALAAYTAQAVNRALLVQERLDALVTLQDALLPNLPRTTDQVIAARYRPAAARDQVGGDWYDAVVMPGGDTSLMIGDVVGHDLGAAATMGQMRNMLRAITWAVDDRPAAHVRLLDHLLHDLEVEGLATLVHARIETVTGPDGRPARSLAWTNAGHPPPLLLAADGVASYLQDGPTDLMIGVLPDVERADHTRVVDDGSTLLLYTDGLVERRGEHLDEGLARLRDAGSRHAHLPVEKFLDAVLRDLVDADLDDDIAVMAVRFTPTD